MDKKSVTNEQVPSSSVNLNEGNWQEKKREEIPVPAVRCISPSPTLATDSDSEIEPDEEVPWAQAPGDYVGKIRNYLSKMRGTDYALPKMSAKCCYKNQEGVTVWVCLVCNREETEFKETSESMVCCEMCEDWYHYKCVGITDEIGEEDPWICKRCVFQACNNKEDFAKIFKA